ncbi:hypothetical protein PMIN04_012763 [Paraphaeosphaeria minitans]
MGQEYKSNIGQDGYEGHAVPSQRFARPTSLHPFNIYRHLRNVNPSPYLFYVDCEDFQIVGASPELLVKEEQGRVITHPIAGTVKRGKTLQEDAALAEELSNSIKDRAEHVMLVDLARNDVNRVCDPLTTTCRQADGRSKVFPCAALGTVSGAPKAGAVGYFGYSGVDGEREIEGAIDTCIALRTMLVKDGIAYLQAGGGIVFDSDPYDEWMETINKLGAHARPQNWFILARRLFTDRVATAGANMRCISTAEQKHLDEQAEAEDAATSQPAPGTNAHISLAA